MQILVTAASQRLNITDPMTVTGTRDADCDEDTQEDTHVAAEPTTEPEFLINNVAEALKWAAQLKMFTLSKDSMSHMNIPWMLNKSFNVCYLCQNLYNC